MSKAIRPRWGAPGLDNRTSGAARGAGMKEPYVHREISAGLCSGRDKSEPRIKFADSTKGAGMKDYLTPDERHEQMLDRAHEPGGWDAYVVLYNSHAVVDGLLTEARAALRCEYGEDGNALCDCRPCNLARRIDALTGGDS